jgi:hypothetical protein
MQIALNQYPQFNQSKTMRETRWIMEMEMVMMMLLMEMLMKRPPLCQGGVVMTMASISPSPKALVLQDLPSPGVGEDFRHRRHLCKLWEEYGVSFLAIQRHLQKRGAETMLEAEAGLGGVPN